MTSGYVYCFSNPSMPDIYKIGMTERTISERLNEANCSDTWRPPTPYIVEIAKKVINPKEKETILHNLLEKYTERINPKREFFRVSITEIKLFFNLMDGEDYNFKDDNDNESINSESSIIGCRDMSKCFYDGQKIRHKIGFDKIWIGIYNLKGNCIIYNNEIYKTLSAFSMGHYKIDKPERISANGWSECECEINNEWVSTYNLSSIG